jgi:hypothetical protein
VSLHEPRSLFDQFLQFHARLVRVAVFQVQCRHLIADRGIVRTDSQRALEAMPRPGVVFILLEQDAKLKVGRVVVRIRLQFLAEGRRGPGRVAAAG